MVGSVTDSSVGQEGSHSGMVWLCPQEEVRVLGVRQVPALGLTGGLSLLSHGGV